MFKKILAYALTVCLLLSFSVPAYAVDDVYSVSDDTVALTAPIFYTADYYPGVVAEMRSSGLFANNIAHGSYSEMNYNPSWFSLKGSSITSGDFNALTPEVLADQSDVSAVYSIPNTSFLNGDSLTFNLPNTEDGYFDFQSSNFLFDQQSPQANTFYVNGTLIFNLRNLWSFTGYDADVNAKNASWYLASDPLAVQLVIDGKAYGDIIDVTGYTSPFTALYNGGIPTSASVTFDNLKVYYQGDTPDMIGFRVYTGSKFTNGSYNYGSYTAVAVTNTVTFRVSQIPDITFVQEGGDSYAGDLSGISGLLSDIKSLLSGVRGLLINSSGGSLVSTISSTLSTISSRINSQLSISAGMDQLYKDGSVISFDSVVVFSSMVRNGFLGLRSLMVDSSGVSLLSKTYSALSTVSQQISSYFNISPGLPQLAANGSVVSYDDSFYFSAMVRNGFLGLRSILLQGQDYVADTVFPWQSYNMETHQLNAATNITGQNNLFLTAFQSMEDKLGRLAYVFGSDEDLALKDEADPGTDAFRENFGGGASLSDIKDASELTTSIPQIMDTGFDFGDALEEIGSNDDFLKWFTSETWSALDSTGAAVAADPDYLSDYYDNLRKVEEKRHWGD